MNITKETSSADWRPTAILAALHDAGWTLTKLAAYHGLTNSSGLSRAFRTSFPAAEKRIADAIGLHPKDIWPSRYNEDGTRKPQGFRLVQFTAAQRVRNGKVARGN